jgi:hypothetical protein
VDPSPRGPRAWLALLPPLALLAWRVAWYPPAALWRDGLLILSLYWIFTLRAYRTRYWLPVTAGVILFLFAISISTQVPFAIDLLRHVL